MKKVEKSNSKLYEEFSKYQQEIIKEPSVGSPLKGDLKDLRSLDFKFQQVSLRICYQYFEGDGYIKFVYFGTRENFYKDVKRYIY